MSYQIKGIPNFSNYYADTNGNIYSKRVRKSKNKLSNKLYKLKLCNLCGYLIVVLYKNCKRNQFYVHRLILKTFVGNCPQYMESCHNNNDKQDNRLENLRWDTKSNNYKDRIKNGTTNNDERNGYSKLNESQVKIIKELLKIKYTEKNISQIFNVSRSCIAHIKQKRTWN